MGTRGRKGKVKITSRAMVRKIAEKCEYHLYEIDDMLYALYATIYDEILKGNSIEFERLFTLEVSETKSMNMNRKGNVITYPKRKNVKLRLTRTFIDELRRVARAEEAEQKYVPQKYPPNPNPDKV